MDTTKDPKDTKDQKATAQATTRAVEMKTEKSTGGAEAPEVFVVKIGGKKKKGRGKRKYSSIYMRDSARTERAVSKASWRVTDAVAIGIDKYRKDSDKSARKRRDGAIKDFPKNLAKAAGKTVRKASWIGNDVAKALRRSGLTRSLFRNTINF